MVGDKQSKQVGKKQKMDEEKDGQMGGQAVRQTERRGWGLPEQSGAVNHEIRTINTCIISWYSMVPILKKDFLLMADLVY